MKSEKKSLDPARVKRSLETLFEIFSNISNHADEVFTKRCPYKNAKSRCTAKFECKNQHYLKKFGEGPVCTGSDFLDYRPAWSTDKKISS